MPRKNTAKKAENEEKKVNVPEAPENEAGENAVIDRILRMNSGYAEVYIDQKGGVFAPGTPQPVRGSAKLYKNKYHQ